MLSAYLIGQSIHDNGIRHQAQRMDFTHQYVGWNLVELDVLEEVADDVVQRLVLVEKLSSSPV